MQKEVRTRVIVIYVCELMCLYKNIFLQQVLFRQMAFTCGVCTTFAVHKSNNINDKVDCDDNDRVKQGMSCSGCYNNNEVKGVLKC